MAPSGFKWIYVAAVPLTIMACIVLRGSHESAANLRIIRSEVAELKASIVSNERVRPRPGTPFLDKATPRPVSGERVHVLLDHESAADLPITQSSCADTAARYGIIPGESWGTASVATQNWWKKQHECDRAVVVNSGLRAAAANTLKKYGQTLRRDHFVNWSQAPRPRDVALVSPEQAHAAGCTALEQRLLATRKLPASIFQDGLSLFDGCKGLARVIASVSQPREVPVVWGLLSLELRAVGSDSTLTEIGGEMAGDRYALIPLERDLAATRKSLSHPAVVVDAGANIGDFSISAWLLHPATQVLSFEPGAETFFVVLWNMAANAVPRLTMGDLGKPGKFGVVATFGALTEDGKNITFHHNPKRSQISAVAQEGSVLPAGWTKRVTPSYNLGRTLDQHGVAVVHTFKLDCEGCEFGILGGLYPWVSSTDRVRRIEGEIHWHLVCPEQYGDPVQHVSRAAADGAERALADRGGCVDARAGDIHAQRRLGENWSGEPGTDVSVAIRC